MNLIVHIKYTSNMVAWFYAQFGDDCTHLAIIRICTSTRRELDLSSFSAQTDHGTAEFWPCLINLMVDARTVIEYWQPARTAFCIAMQCLCVFSCTAVLRHRTRTHRVSNSDDVTNGQTDKETRPFVRCVCQGRPSYRWTKRDAS